MRWRPVPDGKTAENGAVEPGAGIGSVVWWRQSPPTPTIRAHHIGWLDVTGRPHGQVEIRSPHLRPDERMIHSAHAEHLVPATYPAMPILRPAHRIPETELSLEAGPIIDGHTITRRGLVLPWGIEVVAGISAELLVRGPHATIVLQETLQQPAADAVLHTIRRSLQVIASSTAAERRPVAVKDAMPTDVAQASSVLRPCPVDNIRMRAASLAGTSTAAT